MINETDIDDVILVVVDVQERMMRAIADADRVIGSIATLCRGMIALDVPILVTEQYPAGLGQTVPEIREALGEVYNPLEKSTFSAAKDRDFLQAFEASGRHQVLICGVETHICVYQTARDLHNLGYTVEVIADAVGSRTRENRGIAVERLKHHGVDFTSVEMCLFDLLVSAEHENFREISGLIK